MTTQELTTGLIGQLIEIDRARVKKTGVGIYAEVSVLVNRLSDGAKAVESHSPRIAQAKRLWDEGFGSELDFESFEAYLAGIPPVPEFPESYAERFPRIVLVDARINIERTCELFDIRFEHKWLLPLLTSIPNAGVGKAYWIRVQDGVSHKGEDFLSCGGCLAEDEIGLSVHEGLALFAQKPRELARRRRWNLLGSGPIQRGAFKMVPCLEWSMNFSSTRPVLGVSVEGNGQPSNIGTPSRGR